MFAGLVATASSRSSRSSSPTSTSPLSPQDRDFLAGGTASAGRHAPSFASPFDATSTSATSSPRTGGRHDAAAAPPSSTEFLSPYSVGGGYPTPSTGGRRGRFYGSAVEQQSPLMMRSWGTLSNNEVHEAEQLEEDEEEEVVVFADKHTSPVHSVHSPDEAADLHEVGVDGAQDGRVDDGASMHEEDSEDGAEEEEELLTVARPGRRRVSLSPLSSHASADDDEDTNLEKLAKQQSTPSSSASSPSSVASHRHEPPPQQHTYTLQGVTASPDLHSSPRGRSPVSSPRRVFSSSQPITTATLISTARKADAWTDALSPITPPAPATAASPHRAATSDAVDAAADVDGGRERSATQEGSARHRTGHIPTFHRSSSSSSSSSALSSATSSVLSRASTPYAPPPDSPPDSAIKRPPGTVTVMLDDERDGEAEKSAPSPSAEDASTELALTATFPAGEVAVAHHHDRSSTPLLFSAQYTEEEHRVQLETQETEERRCLFRAYKAVLTLYRMWAAEDSEDARPQLGWHAAAAPRITDHAHAQPCAPILDRAPTESFNSSTTGAAERVQHFLNASIESARERRSGSARSASAADMSAVNASTHRTAAAAIAHHSHLEREEEEEGMARETAPHPPLQPPLSSTSSFAAPAAAPPLPSSSSATATLSPPASRHLDYSSLLGLDPRMTSLNDSSVQSSRQPRRPLEFSHQHPQPQPQPHSRLFSPWRVGSSATRAPPLEEVGAAASAAATGVREFAEGTRGTQRGHGAVSRGEVGGEVRSYSPLIPYIRRSSPLHHRTATTPIASTPAMRRESAPSSFASDYMATIDARRRGEEEAVEGRGSEPRQHRFDATSRLSKVPPSSVLSDAFLSFTRQRAETDGDALLRDTSAGSPFSSSTHRAAPWTPALVRSPRVAQVDAPQPSASARRRTPPWNTSPNLRSTAAASRRVCSTDGYRERPMAAGATTAAEAAMGGAEEKDEALGYVPNNAFRQRRRATSLSPPSRSPLDDDALPFPTNASVQKEVDELGRRRARLSSYVQYKRFFDTVYGADRRSPARAEEPRQSPRSSFSFSAASNADAHSRNAPPPTTTYGEEQDVSTVPGTAASRYTTRAGAPTASHTWSPDIYPRRAFPHPSAVPPSRASVALNSSHDRHSSGSSRAAMGGGLAVQADMHTARLARLCTLEKLCRAELQRRWMEDQNALLHCFVMEGTATLQRVRATRDAVGQRDGRRSEQHRTNGVVQDACAWTFIPNEME